MKKFYTEPDFELVNIRLIADVLGISQEPTDEDPVDHDKGEDFEELD